MFRQASPKRRPPGRCWPAIGSTGWRSGATKSTTSAPSGISTSIMPPARSSPAPACGSSRCCLASSTIARGWSATLQWYLDETAESLVHGLSQAFMKRGLPRALMTDNGAAMLAEETVSGLARLGVVHQTTLPYSPYQNAKQESFWGRIEGRLMAMLEGEDVLTLDLLNQASQAWVEQEYHRTRHSEIDTTPLGALSRRTQCPSGLPGYDGHCGPHSGSKWRAGNGAPMAR
jgi:transposase InsO family protein